MEAEIVNQLEMPATDPKRSGQLDTVLQVRVEGRFAVVVRIPKENPTEKEIQDAIQAKLKTSQSLIGKKFQV